MIDKIVKYKNYIILFTGFIFSVFSLGIFNIQIFIFIWPFLFLYYLHHEETSKKPIIIVTILCLISNMLKWIGCSNLNVGIDFIIGLYWGVITAIPFIIDKLLFNKIERWKSILLFPLLVCSIEFLFSLIPISNITIYAYSQAENLPFLQIMSLFGVFFLSFILASFSSIMEYSIDLFIKENKISKLIFIYIIIFIIIYIFGGIRLLIPNDSETIKVVAVMGKSQKYYDEGDGSLHSINEFLIYIKDKMEEANKIKAQLLTFGEEAFYINHEDYDDLVTEVSRYAIDYNLYVILTLDIDYNKDKNNKNSLLMISNKGEQLYFYVKHHPIPIVETGYEKSYDKIKIIETDIGRLSTVICYDMDFPMYINYVGFYHPDIIIGPSWDYKAVAEFHSKEAKFKAIENGFNLLKNTYNGITISSDYKGRTLAYRSTGKKEDYFVVSDIFKKGVKTLYSYIGLEFNYIYIIGIFLVIFLHEPQQKIQ